MFAGVFALTALASFSIPAPAYAADPTPTDQSQANQCQGDETICACPTTGNNVDPNCGKDPVFADCKQDKKTQAYVNCKANNDLFETYVNPLIAFLSIMVGLAVVIGIIVGGIQYIGSAGDPQKAAKGKQHIWNAIIALMVYLLLFALLNFIIPGGLV